MPSSTPSKRRRRAERLEARISRAQKALIQRAAALQGRSLSEFVIDSAQAAALRAIEEMRITRLGPTDSRAFAEALLQPREPTARLKVAAARYLKATGA